MSFESEDGVSVTFDPRAVPTIRGDTRADAMRALGYITASDRLFQMDFTRREAGGRLSEVFGSSTVEMDAKKRVLGLRRVSEDVVANLSTGETSVLEAYADGVNSLIESVTALPFECRVLHYRPDPWTPADSVLCLLSLFFVLCGDDGPKRATTVMSEALPEEVVAFFTPETDLWDQFGAAGVDVQDGRSVDPSVLASVLRTSGRARPRSLVRVADGPAGSNCWAIDKTKTSDGRAILANDMHLGLAVPNALYRANLVYAGTYVAGITIPGLPMVVAGENGRVSWGFTNLSADCLDLVELDLDSETGRNYRTRDGWRAVESVSEEVRVRGAESHRCEIEDTIWGPIAPQPLLGKRVAIRWTALDPGAVDLGFIDMDRAGSVDEAVIIANRWGGPPLNFIAADDRGHIAWTTSGRLPIRRGFEGATARSWADGSLGWDGYVAPEDLPRVVAPRCGFVASANTRPTGADQVAMIGRRFASGYRAHRIRTLLEATTTWTEEDTLRLQLDTTAEPLEYYRDLILSLTSKPSRTLAGEAAEQRIDEAQRLVARWDGQAEPQSSAVGTLTLVRQRLAEAVLSPFLAPCAELDGDFVYSWAKFEGPLRWLLDLRSPELLPDPERFDDWDQCLLSVIDDCLQELLEVSGAASLEDVRWGGLNRARIRHVLASIVPDGETLLSMPEDELPGCLDCVRVASPDFGASMRMVVSPGRPTGGVLHMPCGQSGDPLSPHFADMHHSWLSGSPMPFGGPVTGMSE